jgi:hypothetical protein
MKLFSNYPRIFWSGSARTEVRDSNSLGCVISPLKEPRTEVRRIELNSPLEYASGSSVDCI